MGIGRLLPRRSDYEGLAGHWRGDVLAGVTVGVVALPLALAFGITTGLGAAAGLVTAIVAGLVAAVFGGSSVQVSGPTGAMTVVLVPIVARHGAGAVLVVGLGAGVLLVLAAALKLGRYLDLLPWPLVEGFTAGIAVIILLQQVPAAVGVAKPEGESTLVVAVRALGRVDGATSARAVALTALVVVAMVVGPRLHRSLPASLVGVAVATLVAEALHLDVARIGALPASLPAPALPRVDPGALPSLAGAAFAVALLGGLESLLSAKVADGMVDRPRHDPERELFGQGLANLASPLFGGMPATGAIARTAVNVRAGARTRLAAATHAVLLLGVVYLAGPLVARIPLAALAGVLVVTAVRMVPVHELVAVLRSTRSDAVVVLVTAVATVAFDLVVAVEIGLVVAGALALRKVAIATTATAVPLSPPEEIDGDLEEELLHDRIVAYRLDGVLFFGAAQRFLDELTSVADVDVVILRLPELHVIDATGAQALGHVVADLERRGITVLLKGTRPEHLAVLRAVGVLDRLAHDRHLFASLDDAVAHARDHVRRAATARPAGVA